MNFRVLWLVVLAIFAMAGCGGGGGSPTGGGGGGGGQAGTVSVFATDNLNRDYAHVWVRVYQVDLIGANGNVTVFNDPAGRVIDLRTLRDQTGARFTFLDRSSVQVGRYDSLRLILDKDLTLVRTGQTTGEDRQFPDNLDLAGQADRSQLTFNFTPALNVTAGNQQFVIDFDLENWNVDQNGRVTAVIRRGTENGLENRRRHEDDELKGRVSNLTGTAPNFTFTLSRGQALSVTVRTDSNTSIFNNNGAPNPQLVNNANVEVHGALVNGQFLATSIKIKTGDDNTNEDPHEIKGTFSNLNEGAGTFVVTVRRAEGFVPENSTVTVQVGNNTRFFSDGGVRLTREEFFDALAANTAQEVEVEGTFNGTVFSAVKVKLEDEDEAAQVEVKGDASNINRDNRTLTITAREWQGLNLTRGDTVNVVTTAGTSYRIDSRNGNETVTAQEFWQAVQNGSEVQAHGRINGGTFTATRLRLRD